MDESAPARGGELSLQGILGYVNFSEGKPDARFQLQLNDAYAALDLPGEAPPWLALRDRLRDQLAALKAGGAAAFQDATQAEAVIPLVFDRLLPAYRAHHADLLFHLSERELFQPGLLIRAFEAVLSQGGPWDNPERIVRAALAQLNDYVGYRPVAILETRPRGEPYEHEKLRPLPLYVRGVGALHGRYRELVERALAVLRATEPGILADAYLDPELLDELALDPRAYDHGHPADKRPNYRFGEWDPHHIDGKGRYRRFVVRQLLLDALLERVQEAHGTTEAHGSQPVGLQEDLLQEAATVLAGTILMASGVSGAGPETHDSSVTMSTLVQHIARSREAFYAAQLAQAAGAHGDRLRREAATTRQPFGGARQHINQVLARHRAAQLQQRHLALLLAEMGFPEASRRQAARIPAASVRLLSEMHLRLTAGQVHVDRGELGEAARLLPEVEDLLHRGIACGAVVDPWNVLGFQGLFPLSPAAEDSVADPRVSHLIHVVEQLFNLYARLRGEAAAAGDAALGKQLAGRMKGLAAWWDRFATVEVHDVPHVHGGEAVSSAEHVADALAKWRERGEATADLGFWRQHLDRFRSAKAFALVVDALLRKHDYRASMALLMNWLAQAEEVPLEDAAHSFHALALRWMLAVAGPGRAGQEGEPASAAPLPEEARWPLVRKFLDHLDANAEDYGSVPRLDVLGIDDDDDGEDDEPEEEDEEEKALFGAAYEGVTYRDSADDDVEGELLDAGPRAEFDLQAEGQRLEKQLHFLGTAARLWQIAARAARGVADAGERAESLEGWLARAQKNYQGLLALLEAIHEHAIPPPSGAYDSLVEFERRRQLKEQLLDQAITTCMDTAFAVGALRGALGQGIGQSAEGKRPAWEPVLLRLEQALWQGDAGEARRLLPDFVARFRSEPLLFTPLAEGGHPKLVLRARIAQRILHVLAANLPRVGLLRETYELLHLAWEMEQGQELEGPRVTEFDRLFQVGCQAVVEAVIESAARAEPRPSEQDLVELLRQVIEPFVPLWVQHSRTLRLSVLEAVADEAQWDALRDFIRRYGRDLFHVRFLALANLRGVLHGGVGAYLDYLAQNEDPLHPVRLVQELDVEIPQRDAERHLQTALQALIENYEEYKDYNTTTPQSDYGDNLYLLLDFLRLKASYERHAWQLRPLVLAHEILTRHQSEAPLPWQAQVGKLTREWAERHLGELARLEKQHGMRLRTVADRVNERFVKPLALDRLCAMIEPAVAEARRGGPGEAFARLEGELERFAATTTGVGLDVPHWLRRLEAELYRVRASRTALANLAENLFQIPRVPVPLDELGRQFAGWQKRRREGK